MALVGGVGVALWVVMTAFRHSEWSRLYESKMWENAVAEARHARMAASQAGQAERALEDARWVERHSTLGQAAWGALWSPWIAKIHPRLVAARRQTIQLSHEERTDLVWQLRENARLLALASQRARERAAYHARLKRKYEQAAHYPWLPVAPDPPPPP